MNLWTKVSCSGCGQLVRFDLDTLVVERHSRFLSILQDELCAMSGQPIDPSRLPAWHPRHVHGVYCDGADHVGQALLFSECWIEWKAGPPDAIDALGDLVE
jgi:hypothetical protein